MSTIDRKSPDAYLIGVEDGRKQIAAQQIVDRLEAEGYIRQRIARAVAVQRRRDRRNTIVACAIAALAVYNLTAHGLSLGWLS